MILLHGQRGRTSCCHRHLFHQQQQQQQWRHFSRLSSRRRHRPAVHATNSLTVGLSSPEPGENYHILAGVRAARLSTLSITDGCGSMRPARCTTATVSVEFRFAACRGLNRQLSWHDVVAASPLVIMHRCVCVCVCVCIPSVL